MFKVTFFCRVLTLGADIKDRSISLQAEVGQKKFNNITVQEQVNASLHYEDTAKILSEPYNMELLFHYPQVGIINSVW